MCIIVFGIIPGPRGLSGEYIIVYILYIHTHTHFEYIVFNNNINIMYILLFSLIAFVRTSFLFLWLLVFGVRARMARGTPPRAD